MKRKQEFLHGLWAYAVSVNGNHIKSFNSKKSAKLYVKTEQLNGTKISLHVTNLGWFTLTVLTAIILLRLVFGMWS